MTHETMDSWAPDTLGSRVTEATSEKCAKSFLFQSLSKNLQNGNALCNWNSSSPQKTRNNINTKRLLEKE